MTRHVMMIPTTATTTDPAHCIGEADTVEAAIQMARDAGYPVILKGEGGTVEQYDGEDAPGCLGSPRDGKGAIGITYTAV